MRLKVISISGLLDSGYTVIQNLEVCHGEVRHAISREFERQLSLASASLEPKGLLTHEPRGFLNRETFLVTA